MDEFYLLFGLNGHAYEEVELLENDLLMVTYFPKMAIPKTKKICINKEELKDAFLNCNRRKHKVQLDVAYLVECLVFGNIDKKLIDMDTLQLVLMPLTDIRGGRRHSIV